MSASRLLVGAVDLVDQQHHRLRRADRLEQRPLDQEVLGEEDVLVPRRRSAASARPVVPASTVSIRSRSSCV